MSGAMAGIDAATLDALPLAEIETVTLFKRDEITADLICCEVEIGARTWLFHEEMAGWGVLIRHLEQLPGFRTDWFAAVSRPAFEPCVTVAFRRD